MPVEQHGAAVAVDPHRGAGGDSRGADVEGRLRALAVVRDGVDPDPVAGARVERAQRGGRAVGARGGRGPHGRHAEIDEPVRDLHAGGDRGPPGDRRAEGGDGGRAQVADLERLLSGHLHRGRPRRDACRRERGAVDRPCVDFARRLAKSLVGGFRLAVGPEDTRLPARQVALVVEMEIEVRADRRLAVGDADRVLELHRLVDAGALAAVGRLLRRPGRHRVRIGLVSGEPDPAGIRPRLVALPQVPDARRALAGDGLRRAAEGAARARPSASSSRRARSRRSPGASSTAVRRSSRDAGRSRACRRSASSGGSHGRRLPSFENQSAGGCQASVKAPGVSELLETATAITFAFVRTACAAS